MIVIKKHKNLSLICLDHAGNTSTCNYWYLVQENHSSLVAFETFEGLSRWMAERGINFSQELPPAKTHQYQPLIGEYYDCSHEWSALFGELDGHKTKVLSNAEYTYAIITADDKGLRTVHYMNPNCKGRMVFDYQQSKKEMN